MYADYIASVLQTFHEKKDNHELSNRWSKLTRASLREECLAVYLKGCTKDDAKVLSEFFEYREDEKAVTQKIRDFDINKFRPLVNFINGNTSLPDLKNIELLAWLIDFEPRPLRKYEEKIRGGSSGGGNKKGRGKPKGSSNDDPDSTTQIGQSHQLSKRRIRYLIPLALLFVLLLVGAFLFNRFKNTGANRLTVGDPALTSNESCMYWVEDHYQQIPCNQKVPGAEVIPLDAEKLQHFKKINCPETIKKSEIEKYWYCKLKSGEIEYFTAGGFHPVDTNRRLKPLTSYMYEKYITGRTPCP